MNQPKTCRAVAAFQFAISLMIPQLGLAQTGTTSSQCSPLADRGSESLSTQEMLGCLTVDFPNEVVPEREFELFLELIPISHASNQPTQVVFEQSAPITYQPRSVSLTPGTRVPIKVIVKATPSGLAEVSAVAARWRPVRRAVNSGFRGRLRPSLGNRLEGGKPHSFTIGIVDSVNQPLTIDAPVSITLSANGALLRSESTTSTWRKKLTVYLDAKSSSSELIEVKPQSKTGSTAQLRGVVKVNNTQVLDDGVFEFTILPAWWFPLALSILGGLVGGFYVTVRKFAKTRRSVGPFTWKVALPTLSSSMLAGFVAYLSTTSAIFGIQVDPTAWGGYILLGLLFAYAGVDTVLEGMKRKLEDGKGNQA
jgi:hypothetical protein